MESIFALDDVTKAEMDRAANEKSNRRKLELCCLANKLFVMNKDGKRFLDLFLEDMVVHRETASPQRDAAYAYYTEGENNTVRRMSYFAELYPMVVKKMQRQKLNNQNNEGDV